MLIAYSIIFSRQLVALARQENPTWPDIMPHIILKNNGFFIGMWYIYFKDSGSFFSLLCVVCNYLGQTFLCNSFTCQLIGITKICDFSSRHPKKKKKKKTKKNPLLGIISFTLIYIDIDVEIKASSDRRLFKNAWFPFVPLFYILAFSFSTFIMIKSISKYSFILEYCVDSNEDQ